jgi:hypothetical protein
MNRVSCILLVMTMVLCSTALPTRAEQSEQEVLSSLNNTLQTVVYSTQNPGDNDIEKWNNSYQFAVQNNSFIITYQWDNTYLKGEKIQDHYIETGTFSAPLAMLTHAEISPSPHMIHIAIGCNEEANCFTRDYSGAYEHKGKTTVSEKTKSVNRIALILPEDLIEPTMDLLKELLYP